MGMDQKNVSQEKFTRGKKKYRNKNHNYHNYPTLWRTLGIKLLEMTLSQKLVYEPLMGWSTSEKYPTNHFSGAFFLISKRNQKIAISPKILRLDLIWLQIRNLREILGLEHVYIDMYLSRKKIFAKFFFKQKMHFS